MKRLVVVAVALAGCDLSNDQALDGRPLTLEYITQTILKPSCGTAECHSAMKQQSGDIFDSVAAAKATLEDPDRGLIQTCASLSMDSPCMNMDRQNSYLISVLTLQDSQGRRMPLDQPLSNSNIELIGNWIQAGAPELTLVIH